MQKLLKYCLLLAMVAGFANVASADFRRGEWHRGDDDRFRTDVSVDLGDINLYDSFGGDSDYVDISRRGDCRLRDIEMIASDLVRVNQVRIFYNNGNSDTIDLDNRNSNDYGRGVSGSNRGILLDRGQSSGRLALDNVEAYVPGGRCITRLAVYGTVYGSDNSGYYNNRYPRPANRASLRVTGYLWAMPAPTPNRPGPGYGGGGGFGGPDRRPVRGDKQTVTCESDSYRYKACDIPGLGSYDEVLNIRLVNQRSNGGLYGGNCRLAPDGVSSDDVNYDWGYDLRRGYIWVNHGCRADFEAEVWHKGGNGGGNGGGGWGGRPQPQPQPVPQPQPQPQPQPRPDPRPNPPPVVTPPNNGGNNGGGAPELVTIFRYNYRGAYKFGDPNNPQQKVDAQPDGPAFAVKRSPGAGLVPLNMCHAGNDYFLSVAPNVCEGQAFNWMLGYVSPTQVAGAKLLQRGIMPGRGHFESTDPSELQGRGYTIEGPLGYVW